MNKKRIVITGVGPIACTGIGKDFFWEGAMAGHCGVEKVQALLGNDVWEEYFIHKVKGFQIEDFNLDEQFLCSTKEWKEGEDNKDLYLLMAAIELALTDSNIDYRQENELALVVTHENLGMEQLLWKSFLDSYELGKEAPEMSKIDFFEKLYQKVDKVGYEAQTFMSLFHIARIFNIHKYSIFNNNACASGLFSLEIAKDIIETNKSSTVIIAAGDCPDVFKHKWFKDLGIYAEDGLTKPFDPARNGFLLGEGSSAIILEELNHALDRGAPIYGEYLGSGFRLEGWGISTPKIGGDFLINSIKDSLSAASIGPDDVDVVCSHGVGTQASDYYEAQAIKKVFKKQPADFVTAFKPILGHNLGGSTLLELILLILAMNRNCIPAVLNTAECDSRLNLNLVLNKASKEVETILKICCAFAGFDAATIIRKYK